MMVILRCTCGRCYQVEYSDAGSTFQCPNCNATMSLPRDTTSLNEARVASTNIQAAPSNSIHRSSTPQQRDDGYHSTEDPLSADREFNLSSIAPLPPVSPGRFKGFNLTIPGGLLLMTTGVFLFFGMLAAGWICVWPLAISAIGVILLSQGIANWGHGSS
jgi:hypothetical protein